MRWDDRASVRVGSKRGGQVMPIETRKRAVQRSRKFSLLEDLWPTRLSGVRRSETVGINLVLTFFDYLGPWSRVNPL